MRRVAITGLGVVSAVGTGVPAFWDALVNARSGVVRITTCDTTGLANPIAAEVAGFDGPDWMPAEKRDQLDRFSRFALAAAGEALGHANLLRLPSAERAGVAVGSAMGGVTTEDHQFRRLYKEGHTRLHPLTIPRLMNNAAASHVSMAFGAGGPSLSVATACAAGTHAIGEAAEIIRAGRADVMLAGGSDAPLTFSVLKAWEALRVLAPEPATGPASACRPFSRDRLGLVIGEGAGMLVLEAWDHALARGASILAELAGYGATADAGHLTQPGIDAPARAMQLALAQAGLAPDDVGHVNAHGTGTTLNDATETAMLHRVFGSHARQLAISATKSMHGHVMGASGAIELIATVLALQHGRVPPTAHYTEADPACDLDYVPNRSRAATIDAAVSCSFAFGGLNAVLAVRRAEARPS